MQRVLRMARRREGKLRMRAHDFQRAGVVGLQIARIADHNAVAHMIFRHARKHIVEIGNKPLVRQMHMAIKDSHIFLPANQPRIL